MTFHVVHTSGTPADAGVGRNSAIKTRRTALPALATCWRLPFFGPSFSLRFDSIWFECVFFFFVWLWFFTFSLFVFHFPLIALIGMDLLFNWRFHLLLYSHLFTFIGWFFQNYYKWNRFSLGLNNCNQLFQIIHSMFKIGLDKLISKVY